MADAIEQAAANLESPAWDAVVVSPSDGSDLARVATRALYIGGAGDIKVNMSGTGTAITFVGLLAGTILPIRVDRVYSTDTDATDIVALY
jgi:hypothetical protein